MYHYRHVSLKATTIQDLTMYKCMLRFDVEGEQLAFIDEYLLAEEAEAVAEEKDT
ncbi:hypothetical protein EYZ11_011065 [Aspergillus tanneri]|uniref:Uncharacterized protein n=1 Tax=Aspergillus tanneri TaxID=1220188 RepID=A0A4S3J961_9EURO|nr:hypothetical protein EYZ11_011065 [Aspergillus tanneri]